MMPLCVPREKLFLFHYYLTYLFRAESTGEVACAQDWLAVIACGGGYDLSKAARMYDGTLVFTRLMAFRKNLGYVVEKQNKRLTELKRPWIGNPGIGFVKAGRFPKKGHEGWET